MSPLWHVRVRLDCGGTGDSVKGNMSVMPEEGSSGQKNEGMVYYGGGSGTAEDPYIISDTLSGFMYDTSNESNILTMRMRFSISY